MRYLYLAETLPVPIAVAQHALPTIVLVRYGDKVWDYKDRAIFLVRDDRFWVTFRSLKHKQLIRKSVINEE